MDLNYFYDANDPLKPFIKAIRVGDPRSSPPRGSTRVPCEVVAGQWPCWDGEAWINVENHREEKGYVNGKAFEIKDLGPYPEGWSTEPPPLTPEEIEARRVAPFLAELAGIDLESIRPLRAIAEGDATPADTAKLAALEAKAAELRSKISNPT